MCSGARLIELADLRRVTEASIRRAGARYTPVLDPDAPNLQITMLIEAFDALTRSSSFQSRLLKLETEISGVWSSLSKDLRESLPETGKASALCSDLLKTIRTQAIVSQPHLEGQFHQIYDDIRSALRRYEDELDADRDKYPKGTQERSSFDKKIEEARHLRQVLDELDAFLSSTAFRVIYNNRLFLKGAWGTGKTHLLCDIANERVKRDLPTLLVLAQTLPAGMNPLLAMFQASGLGSDVESALQDLNRLGKQAGGRALILIDAVNEGDRVAWSRHIEQMVSLIGRYPNVALVLSCRTPFDRQILTDAAARTFVFASHVGFADIEFDAQTEFFRYYGIPHPHVPLLAPEFSTPLFLKIFCASIAKLSQSAKKRRVKNFASGHKGMTKLLEDFVVEVGKNIERDFGLPSKACWGILKGRGDAAAAIGMAPRMAELMDDKIILEDAVDIISRLTNFDRCRSGELIAGLVNDGLLSEDSQHENGNWINIIRLPYQRFSDHLISRHLLARHLDTASEEVIRQCFRPSEPLGKIFELERWGDYKMPGLVSAVMLEFPERVKRSVHPYRQELAFYIPDNLRTGALSEPFIEGLLWRDVDSFSKQTDKLVKIFLGAASRETREGMLEALVGLASRSDHRYRAETLRRCLQHMTLPDRDLFWTEFLRSRSKSSAVYRVLDWVQQSDSINMDEVTARNLIILVSMFLTSTVRTLRDRATHCLVLLGERSPVSLFAEVSRSFIFNDPYVSDRMLAAAYGVLMRKWAFSPTNLKGAALPLALELRERLVGTDEKAPIEHILMRDYAQGFIELAARLSPDQADVLLNSPRPISPKTVLRPPSRISEKSVEGAKSAIHIDFGNYTIGRLVRGRSNYDDSHEGYRATRRRIERRILDLGYDPGRFNSIDGIITGISYRGRQSRDGQKTDRYGKKYSWIAFYEVAGRLALRRRLHDAWEARLSDIDIDPSFPATPREWRPALRDPFAEPFTNAAEWLQNGASPNYGDMLVLDAVDGHIGPWVLLDGFIREASANDHRRVFTFLRGVFIKPEDIRQLRTALKNTEYPGNHAIPEALEDHYLFAGEIGWSTKYGRGPGRRIDPHVEEALARREIRKTTKRFGDLDYFERIKLNNSLPASPRRSSKSTSHSSGYSKNDIVAVDVYKKIRGLMVEVPVRHFAWESYHSEENQSRAPLYPAPSLVRSLNLRKFGPQIDMLDQNGKLATIYRDFRPEGQDIRSRLLFMRADALEKYLRQRQMTLIWINWGEREIDHRAVGMLRNDPEIQALWGRHDHIHKELFVYDSARRRAENVDIRG